MSRRSQKAALSLATPFLVTASLSGVASAQTPPKAPTQAVPPQPKRVNTPRGIVRLQANGVCRLQVKTPRCPKGARCNPPGPQPVKCPPELDPGIPESIRTPEGTIFRRPNGTCDLLVDEKCEAGATCNPPGPQRVKCPPQLTLQGARQQNDPRFAPPPP